MYVIDRPAPPPLLPPDADASPGEIARVRRIARFVFLRDALLRAPRLFPDSLKHYYSPPIRTRAIRRIVLPLLLSPCKSEITWQLTDHRLSGMREVVSVRAG